ncbi:MAG TPA: hypothetical protein VN937_03475 [Blastocatellia bacterium]|nr:hypothetical protein [Blastocatellia bacterium]
MKVTKESIETFAVEFDSEEELRREFEANLRAGGLFLPSTEKPAEMSTIQLNLRLSDGGSFATSATVVRLFDGAFAVSIEANPGEILSSLTTKASAFDETTVDEKKRDETTLDEKAEVAAGKQTSVWDRVRALSYAEKIILATKTDRSERAVLIQENDPQILYYLLKNPRITTEEVLRIARMTSISAMVADQIAKTSQWSTNQEIRSALVNNPRTAPSLALKLLPTLPESEIRHIAKSTAVSQALKQSAMRILMSRS